MALSVEQIARGLEARASREALDVGAVGVDRPILRLRLGGQVLTVDLVVLGVRTADLTAHPAAAVALLTAEAHLSGADPNGWLGALHAYLSRWLDTPATRTADPALAATASASEMLRLLGRHCFPLLRGVYDAAHIAPLEQIPLWAARVLVATRPTDAARIGFGSRATKPLARALSRSLVPPRSAVEGATVALGPLGVALVGADIVEPDHLCRVLTAVGPWQPPHRWPTNTELKDGRSAAVFLGKERVRRILHEGVHDPRELFETLRLVNAARSHLRPPLPSSLGDLKAVCTAALTPRPSAQTAPQTPRPPAPAAPRATAPARAEVALTAPSSPSRPQPVTFITPQQLAAVDGRPIGRRHHLCLPHSPDDLRSWGTKLENCLGSFVDAVTAGNSWLIGIAHDSQLVGCVEITPPTQAIRQMLGPNNRRLSDALATATVAELVALGVVIA